MLDRRNGKVETPAPPCCRLVAEELVAVLVQDESEPLIAGVEDDSDALPARSVHDIWREAEGGLVCRLAKCTVDSRAVFWPQGRW
jgi:hypothetical protein